ncbi:MAG TPA: 3',5'-nucleoside bisphosphate phosphatase [Rhodocyclaceae bacterium]|jgi:predicted metal-dependent phosphoesterase TrpH|nr:3',5'-nucleoside bisphosphate phosphatase [Rhodocyclaceae bacterium]
MNADMHCHSYYSDGLLSPSDVMRRAHAHGVELATLTDHDETAGVPEAHDMAIELGMRFVSGVEISVTWGNEQTIHMVGLGIDIYSKELSEGLDAVRSGRDSRAMRIGDELEREGIDGAYQGAMRHARNPALISRSHFARYIVERGLAKDVKAVFSQWLGAGRPGYVPHQWATLEQAVRWITSAGGIAVVAHPGRYWLEPKEMQAFLSEFKELGGRGIEVLSSSHKPDKVEIFADYCRRYGFLASRASDFHAPGESWTDLGKLPDLPGDLKPVWSELI